MTQHEPINSIPHDTAFQLCAEIRQECRGKWFSAAYWQCGGCVRFSKGDPARMCVSNAPGYRGCNLVNARYDGLARSQARRARRPLDMHAADPARDRAVG